VREQLRSQGVRVSQSQPRSASKHRLICNRILNCIGKRWSVRSVLACMRSAGVSRRNKTHNKRSNQNPAIYAGFFLTKLKNKSRSNKWQ